MVQEDAALSVSRDDRFEEDRRREEGAKLRSRSSPFGGDARMDDLRGSRVARRRFGDRLGQSAAAARGGDQERLNFGSFRTGFVEAHVGAKEPRQREQLLQRLWQFFQVDDQLVAGSRDQGGLRHRSVLRMLAELDARTPASTASFNSGCSASTSVGPSPPSNRSRSQTTNVSG